MVKNLPANAVNLGLIPGSGRSPGEGNGSILAWEIPWTEEPGGPTGIGHAKSQTRLERLTLMILRNSPDGGMYLRF